MGERRESGPAIGDVLPKEIREELERMGLRQSDWEERRREAHQELNEDLPFIGDPRRTVRFEEIEKKFREERESWD